MTEEIGDTDRHAYESLFITLPTAPLFILFLPRYPQSKTHGNRDPLWLLSRTNPHVYFLCSPVPILYFSVLLILFIPPQHRGFLDTTIRHFNMAKIIQTFNGTIHPTTLLGLLHLSQIADLVIPALRRWILTLQGYTLLAKESDIRLSGELKGRRQAFKVSPTATATHNPSLLEWAPSNSTCSSVHFSDWKRSLCPSQLFRRLSLQSYYSSPPTSWSPQL